MNFAGISKLIDETGEIFDALRGHTQMLKTVKLDRDLAQQQIVNLVQSLNNEQLKQFEERFVNSSLLLVNAGQRTRAMELYAWLKLCEAHHYGEFRGFNTPSGPLV